MIYKSPLAGFAPRGDFKLLKKSTELFCSLVSAISHLQPERYFLPGTEGELRR